MTEDTSSHGADRPASSGANPRAATFTLKEVLSAGWIGLTRRFWLGIGITWVYGSISYLGSALFPIERDVSVLSLLFLLLFDFPLAVGWALVCVRLGDVGLGNEDALRFADLFAGFRKFGTSVGAGFLFLLLFACLFGLSGALVGIGIAAAGAERAVTDGNVAIAQLLAAVPICLLTIRFSCAFMLIPDRDLGVIDSFKTSWRITRGNTWRLLALGLCGVVILLIGALLLGVGLLPATVLVMGMSGAAYRRMVEAW